jgi:DNA-binding transcriptional MocR family regulator
VTTDPLPDVLVSIPDGVIDLSWGHPSASLHAVEAIREAALGVFERDGLVALQYGAEQGFGGLLDSLSGFLSRQDAYAMTVEPGSLFLTAGASQALDLACTALTEPGDTIFVEEPTYYLVSQIFRDHGLDVLGVPTDTDGLRTDALEAMLKDPAVPRPAALYTIPTFQNPSGTVLSESRRQVLVQLAHRHGFVVLSDDVYQLLYYGPPPPPPIVASDDTPAGCVVSLGSFSKILAPGLRLGWIQTNPQLLSRFLALGLVGSGGGLNQLASVLVHATIERDLLGPNITRLRDAYAGRVEAVTSALRGDFGDQLTFAVPGGGYFCWLNFPPGVDTEQLLPIAEAAGVSYRPGPRFSPSGQFANSLRISFALYEAPELELAAHRLAEAYAEYST